METTRQCPVTGDRCQSALCTTQPSCEVKAEEIVWMAPDEMTEAIEKAAVELNLDPELFGDFVYENAMGAGSAGELHTDSPSPF